MRVKTEIAQRPQDFTVIREDNKAVITFYTDIEEIERGGETVYAATAWTVERAWSSTLPQRIAENTAKWLADAKTESYNEAAAKVRAERNALLSDTDKEMAFDRLSITLPESITTKNMLSSFVNFVKSLQNVTSGNMAQYRQALRDITTQEGFPYDVSFPKKP